MYLIVVNAMLQVQVQDEATRNERQKKCARRLVIRIEGLSLIQILLSTNDYYYYILEY